MQNVLKLTRQLKKTTLKTKLKICKCWLLLDIYIYFFFSKNFLGVKNVRITLRLTRYTLQECVWVGVGEDCMLKY